MVLQKSAGKASQASSKIATTPRSGGSSRKGSPEKMDRSANFDLNSSRRSLKSINGDRRVDLGASLPPLNQSLDLGRSPLKGTSPSVNRSRDGSGSHRRTLSSDQKLGKASQNFNITMDRFVPQQMGIDLEASFKETKSSGRLGNGEFERDSEGENEVDRLLEEST